MGLAMSDVAAGPDPHRALLEAHGVSISFGGITALDGVSVDVSPGEVLGVIGPNGAGKTTLFNVICGFVSPNEGEIRWKGELVRRAQPHRLASMGIARTLQGVGLFSGLSVLENVMMGANRFRRGRLASALLGLPDADRDERALRERAMNALERLGCADVADRRPTSLPYPLQKRVALARALAAEPELLLLDEPAGGLGGDDMDDLAALIRELRGQCAVMLVEHHMDLVMAVCDRICVLDFGRLVSSGTPDQVRADEHVIEAYLGRVAEREDSVSIGAADAPA
jgi:branched-chain amino acid transport system ATP-binding protein